MPRPSLVVRALISIAIAAGVMTTAACSGDHDVDRDRRAVDDEWGMDGPLEATPAPGKEDGELRRGLRVDTDTRRTQVWTARNRWEDTTTAAARKGDLGWPADSGLTWDQKYARWIESMTWTPAPGGYQTVVLTTPWGKTLPSPALECAEMSIFLRITFAAWYELPLFFEASAGGTRVYVGHNGVRTAAGRYARSPEFAIAYRDQTSLPEATWMRAWPRDPGLRARRLAGGDDEQPMIGPGASFGAYLDEIHLNKRAGYFTLMALDYLGSANLADTANTYNVVAEAVRPGDTLIERWQQSGIGHSLVVKEVTAIGEGNLDVVTVSGSMPRRQAKRESGVASKQYFTSAYTGGPGVNVDGDSYARLGGGLKRYRVAKAIGGIWTNTWMTADEARWINSTDLARISARPLRFAQMLGQVSPEQLQAELLAQIDDARRHLRSYPASCAARDRRERAFDELYDLLARERHLTRIDVDRSYRALDDYALAELVYSQSKTCCWNSSTAAMYDVVMDLARGEQGRGACVAPTAFMSQDDGYARWADQAARTGHAWRPWSEDEPCAQRAVARDREAEHQATPWCQLAGGGAGCTDALEPNGSVGAARAVTAGVDGLRICAGDDDWFTVSGTRTVRIELGNEAGDLDLASHDASGVRVAVSQTSGRSERVTVPAGGSVRVYGYHGATGSYRLVLE